MKLPLVALLCLVSLSACAQSPAPDRPGGAKPAAAAGSAATPGATPEARARAALAAVNPQIEIDAIGPSELKGFQEVIVGGQVIYVSDDGRYLLQGRAYDITGKQELGAARLNAVRAKLLATVPEKDRIVFRAPEQKYTVAVFTDVECGYCQKMHHDIAAYNAAGITVEYLAFPRMGPGTADFSKMVSVWCSKDRNKALTDAKNGQVVSAPACTSPVMMQYALGQRVGLAGTPMIVAEDGTAMPGYMPPGDLRAALDRIAAEGQGAAGSR